MIRPARALLWLCRWARWLWAARGTLAEAERRIRAAAENAGG